MWLDKDENTAVEDVFARTAEETARLTLHPQNVKQCYVLRDPHLRFGSDAVEIIIMFYYAISDILSGLKVFQ